MPQRLFPRLPLALLALLLSASCTDESELQCGAACIDGFEVFLEGASPLPEGSYVIEVAFPDEVITCQRTIPPDDTIPVADCAFESRVEVGRIQPPQSAPTGFFVSTREHPEALGVTIRRGEVVIAAESFRPEYRRGEVCGSTCSYASENVRLEGLDGGVIAN